MKLTIPDVPPSLNKVLRMHWRVRKDLYVKWEELIRSAALPGKVFEEKRKVRITMFHSRFYDKDNAYGAVKPVVDALDWWSHIEDDNEAWLELTVEQVKCPHKQRHTVIEIETVEDKQTLTTSMITREVLQKLRK